MNVTKGVLCCKQLPREDILQNQSPKYTQASIALLQGSLTPFKSGNRIQQHCSDNTGLQVGKMQD